MKEAAARKPGWGSEARARRTDCCEDLGSGEDPQEVRALGFGVSPVEHRKVLPCGLRWGSTLG